MSDLIILKYPDPALRKKAIEIVKITDAERNTLTEMSKIMYLNSGVGLAATQLGIGVRLAVIDVGLGLLKMINPAIIKTGGTESQEEGCLSVPDTMVAVRRAKMVVVDFVNENGEVKRLSADGLLARAIQHEIDHLSGKLIVDYMHPVKKLFLKNNSKRG